MSVVRRIKRPAQKPHFNFCPFLRRHLTSRLVSQYNSIMHVKQVAVVTKLNVAEMRKETRHVHMATLRKVKKFLSGLGIRHRVWNRNHLSKPLKADLVLAVGGDGTVLAASHFTNHAPLLGINSAPKTSTGFFCAANPQNFPKIFRAILAGRKKPKSVPRLEVFVNGKKFPHPGLNDLLFASRLQGDTARYRIRIGRHQEDHKSSGVWVATGAGSSAAIFSAGGKKDSPFSGRLQYRIREPLCFPKKQYRLLHGFLKRGKSLTLISNIRQGMIFLDGAKLHAHVPKHARIVIRGGRQRLRIFL